MYHLAVQNKGLKYHLTFLFDSANIFLRYSRLKGSHFRDPFTSKY